ncbi:putative Monomeric sarcosine oxidase [Hypsibius exemplaris]|uniref:Monomeric sarcosine oxidase n=1 Tax=Hypsibius exemplaris TaxID=2072580 RepID=A0A1W0WPD3_HYPEX|nr:putative Monomeric sarcosine oxidase [Hypsibius exemplaris]
MALYSHYDYVVVGVGGIGSGSLYWLTKLAAPGQRVLGVEQFRLGHDNGSSQDVSRIIRYMYHDPDYVRLAPGSFEAFAEVEEESGIKLVTMTGSVFFTDPADGHAADVEEYAAALTQEKVPFERLDGPGLNRRFPQFNTAHRNLSAIYQKDGGFVNAGLANAVHTQLARARGAEILENTKVTKIEKQAGELLLITTDKGDRFTAGKLIISAGCWNNNLLKHFDMQVSITCTQEQVSYFATPNLKEFLPERFPVWMSVGKTFDYYGIPINPGVNTGVKIAADCSGNICTPDTRTFDAHSERLQAATEFLGDFLPRAVGPLLYTKTCLYELTPDRHFILDSLACKGFPNVYAFMGCGHGFKFASLVGKIFAQLAVTGQTEYPLSENFRIDRPALQLMDVRGNVTFGHRDHLKLPGT